jgi:hypothetical protein
LDDFGIGMQHLLTALHKPGMGWAFSGMFLSSRENKKNKAICRTYLDVGFLTRVKKWKIDISIP